MYELTVSPRNIRVTRLGVACLALLASIASSPSALADDCASNARCFSTQSFTASLSDVRTSTQGAVHHLTLTFQFRNKSALPLTLGYVGYSGVVADDQGNRYREDTSPAGLRGIGLVTDRSIDPRFTLTSGETASATISFVGSFDARVIRGTVFNVDFAVSEITAVGANQYRTGRQHSLNWSNLTAGSGSAANESPAVQSPANAVVAAPTRCKDGAACVDSGAFDIELVSLVESMGPANRNPRTHHLRITFRATNRADSQMRLGYLAGSALAINSAGNRYTSRYLGSLSREQKVVQGIGLVGEGNADPGFVLAPGESRNFTIEVYHSINPREPRGASPYSLDLTLAELAVTPSNQVTTLREHSISFPALTAGVSTLSGLGSDTGDALLKTLFDKLKVKPR
ncbi:MAG: hypothetical protein AB7T20_07140 [Steroidobacteraceae bacterium]